MVMRNDKVRDRGPVPDHRLGVEHPSGAQNRVGAQNPPGVEHPPGHVNGRLFSDADHPTVLRTDFDVPAYLASARGRIAVDTAGIELSQDTARDLHFLWRLESSALAETRAVLASWSANEARITAFITAWGFERYWMARALRDILEAASAPAAAPASASGPARGWGRLSAKLRGAWVERGLPIFAPVLGGIVKEPLTAGHMARLAIQEDAVQVAENALLPRLEGEAARVLAEVAGRRTEIIRFFRTEAIARITRSRTEALTARVHLARPWAPLRVVGVPEPDEAEALTSLFASSADRRSLRESEAVIGRFLSTNPQPSTNQIRQALRTTRRTDAKARRDNGV